MSCPLFTPASPPYKFSFTFKDFSKVEVSHTFKTPAKLVVWSTCKDDILSSAVPSTKADMTLSTTVTFCPAVTRFPDTLPSIFKVPTTFKSATVTSTEKEAFLQVRLSMSPLATSTVSPDKVAECASMFPKHLISPLTDTLPTTVNRCVGSDVLIPKLELRITICSTFAWRKDR